MNKINSTAGADSTPDGLLVIGQHVKQMFKVINKIGTLGIDTTLETVPKFVLVGDQSAGKSSVIEALCGISLPRSQGTCTKCPFQITTAPTKDSEGSWSCKVSLIGKYKPISSNRAKSKYRGWEKLEAPESVHFKTVHRKEDLEDTLRRAQVAILNPMAVPNDYLYSKDIPLHEKNTAIRFSPNVINLELEGPGLPNISFFDLPGAINVHQDDQTLVKFVEDLAKEYISDESALVLLAHPLNVDINTSTAFKYIKEEKAEERCMGVLTKPDTLDSDDYEELRIVLSGERFALGHGWFVTKQLSPKELNEAQRVTHEEARRREQDFFANEEPWSTHVAGFSDHFGIPNLREAVSKQLTQDIIQAIPQISSKIEAELAKVNRRLETFPAQPTSVMVTVAIELAKLLTTIERHIKGHDGKNQFLKTHRMLIQRLQSQLGNARPTSDLKTPGFKKPVPDAIELIDSDDDETQTTPQSSRLAPQSSSRKRRLNDEAIPYRQSETPGARVKRVKTETAHAPTAKAFTLKSVKDELDDGTTSDIPDQVPPEVTDRMILQCLQPWRPLITQFLEQIQANFEGMIQTCLEEVLNAWQQTLFCRETAQTIDQYLSAKMGEVHNAVMILVDRECHKPVTFARKRINKEIAERAAQTKNDRFEQRAFEHFTQNSVKESDQEKTLKNPAFRASFDHDPYEREVKVIAKINAYYDFTADHVLDSIAKCLNWDLYQTVIMELGSKLNVGLQVNSEESCAKLLAEDPKREELRLKLMSLRDRLMQALNEVRSLQRGGMTALA